MKHQLIITIFKTFWRILLSSSGKIYSGYLHCKSYNNNHAVQSCVYLLGTKSHWIKYWLLNIYKTGFWFNYARSNTTKFSRAFSRPFN